MEITQQLLSETERRFRERQPKREEHLEKISTGDVLSADAPERVEMRLRRIARAAGTSEPAGADGIALERVLGTNDLISISYLELGLRVSGHVGRIVVRDAAGRVRGYGTGSMVAPRLLLTNNHVLSTAQEAAFSLIEFNFYVLPNGGRSTPVVFDLDPGAFFLTSVPLDYTLVAVKERALSGEGLASQGWSQLTEAAGKVIIGEALNIIQHPNGEPKQLALRQNELIDVLENHVHYRTDTAPGSSGSPVYNDQWEVVALHHSGVPRRDADGNLLTKDGTLWRPQMGEHRIDWIANEGVRISRIVKDIKAQPLSEAARRLRDSMFSAAPQQFIAYIPPLVGQAIKYYSCFISYSSKDQAFANRIHTDLQSKGVRCWFAPEDMKIGDRFRDQIDESIRVHEKLLLILSENSVASDWVEKEVQTAMEKERENKNTILFPVRLDDSVNAIKSGWAADVRRTRHIGDFSNWKNHDEYGKVLERLLRDLKKEGQGIEPSLK